MNIHELYDQITIEHIHEFIADSQEENVNLDFKTITRPDLETRDTPQFFREGTGKVFCVNGRRSE